MEVLIANNYVVLIRPLCRIHIGVHIWERETWNRVQVVHLKTYSIFSSSLYLKHYYTSNTAQGEGGARPQQPHVAMSPGAPCARRIQRWGWVVIVQRRPCSCSRPHYIPTVIVKLVKRLPRSATYDMSGSDRISAIAASSLIKFALMYSQFESPT